MNSAKKSNVVVNKSKPFCKVCFDAKKPENVYTSHFVKDQPGIEGKVVCPYLLSLTCTYCKKKEGHTARHCPVLLKKLEEIKEPAPMKAYVAEEAGWSRVKGKHNANAAPATAPAAIMSAAAICAFM